MDFFKALFCLPAVEMDDSLTYAGVQRDLLALRVQAKAELILRDLRNRLLDDKDMMVMPNSYKIPYPCRIQVDEIDSLLLCFSKYGWRCTITPCMLIFSHPHGIHTISDGRIDA
jgi:hypothetical protein